MKIEQAKAICQEKLTFLKEKFVDAGVNAIEEVEAARYEAIGTEPSDRLVVSLAISLKDNEDKVLYLSQEVAYLSNPDEVEDNFAEPLGEFEKECLCYAERIKDTEDKAAIIDKINEELYGKLIEETENNEKAVNRNLYTALVAAGLVALCAILSIVIELLL